MKNTAIALVSFIPIILLTGCNENKQNTNNSTNAERTSLIQKISNSSESANSGIVLTPVPQMITIGATSTNTQGNTSTNPFNTNSNISTTDDNNTKEEEISSFTTEILTDDDKRESNIEITCSKLNNYTVKAGETFSFTETVGKATEDKGYQKADIFDANGNKTKGLGGGNCQVSSTLYNAVLEANGNFEIVERHPHSQKVYYVPDGKDATVSYGSLDFKFKNNNNFDVKIYASTDTESVNIRLVKLH